MNRNRPAIRWIGQALIALLVWFPVAAKAEVTMTQPSVSTVPVFQVTPPATLPPSNELPTSPYSAGMYSAILSQANSSYELPTSPAPALPNCSGYNLNRYSWYWPTVAQSETWWAAQPGATAPGTEAYTIGIAISHQQQEGWQLAGGCVYDPQPSCGANYTNNSIWGGQFSGWTTVCTYNPPPPPYVPPYVPPTCSGSPPNLGCGSRGPGSYGPPVCQNGNWVCPTPIPQPSCPSGDGGTYVWYGYPYYTWHSNCTSPVSQPTGGGNQGGGAVASNPVNDTPPPPRVICQV
jgi:hypothetical protein